MALFVFGAGATRGCSFVSPTLDPCIPPLDGDFFTQLQRVRNPKHQKLIKALMGKVVDLFGPNFDATMETVFTTLEHTIRMIEATGAKRAFKLKDLREFRYLLTQSVAVILEDSIAEKKADGTSKTTPRICAHHEKLVKEQVAPKDYLISFNYDCVLDWALRMNGDNKWNSAKGYGLHKIGGMTISGAAFWQPGRKASAAKTCHLLKLHGSLNFHVKGNQIHLKERPYTYQGKGMRFTIIPPEWHKDYDKGVFKHLWTYAAKAIRAAEHIVFVGYSLPATDVHSTALFRTNMVVGKIKSLVIVNPDAQARQRTRIILQRGLSRDTRVFSYSYLAEFLGTPRILWEV